MASVIDRWRRRAWVEGGFTLVELLVVILIIGILAAIAIPSFLDQRAKAVDAEAKAVVLTAEKAMRTYFTDNESYVGVTKEKLIEIEPSLALAADRLNLRDDRYYGVGPNYFVISVVSERDDGTGNTYFRSRETAKGVFPPPARARVHAAVVPTRCLRWSSSS